MNLGSSEDLARDIESVVRKVIGETRPHLIKGAIHRTVHESVNKRHPGNFLSDFDIHLHERYKELLSETLGSFIYLSEEADPAVIGQDTDEPELCVLVDPLDTSELAVRALLGYTHVLVLSRSLGRPVAAVVGDFFHEIEMFTAYQIDENRDIAFAVTRDGTRWPLRARAEVNPLSQSLITNYSMKPAERFVPLSRQMSLLKELGASDSKALGRIGVDFGSVGLCHVAMGSTDAMVEFAKGFAAWDLFPGKYILEAAGGVVRSLSGEIINMNWVSGDATELRMVMDKRFKFVAAANESLASEIVNTLV